MTRVFLSYPTMTDADGDVAEFRRRLEQELRGETGDRELVVFQDKSHIDIGERWEDKLDHTLAQADCLVALVQPLFLTSPWCRREVLRFDRISRERGLRERIVPVLWRGSLPTGSGDVETLLAAIQHYPWTPYRVQHDWGPKKRAALSELAEGIARRLAQAPAPTASPAVITPAQEVEADAIRQLRTLLLHAFSASEMRRLIRSLPGSADLHLHLPGPTAAPAALADAIVDVLQRHERIDTDFFALLRRERPRRAAEIDAVARRFNLH